MKNQILLTDIKIVLKTIVAENVELFFFDPHNQLVENTTLSKQVLKSEKTSKVLVTFKKEVSVYKNISLNEFDYIISFDGKLTQEVHSKNNSFSYINNTNKSIRWIFPNNLKTPTFLNLFNTSSLKAKIYKALTKIAFACNLKSLISSGEFVLYSKKQLKINKLLNNNQFSNYSIFTGTVGPNRKAIIELNNNEKTEHFIKLPLSKKAQQLINHELSFLKYLETKKLDLIETPVVSKHLGQKELTSNVKNNSSKSVSKISQVHFNALEELYSKSVIHQQLRWNNLLKDINLNIHSAQKANKKETNNILSKLVELKNRINPSQQLAFGICHNDFTPWNTYVCNNKLQVYDWELASKSMPLLFDLFHFIFQNEVLVNRSSIEQINLKIEKTLANKTIKRLVKRNNINVRLNYQLYLLHNIAYYTNIYAKQENLHTQAYWLLSIWEQALTLELNKHNVTTSREDLIVSLNKFLSKKPHAFLKFHEQVFTNVKESSDLDILVNKKDINSIIKFCKNQYVVNSSTVHKRSFMTTLELKLNDGRFLSLDLIHKFKRKTLVMMDGKTALKAAKLNPFGISVPVPAHDFEYTFLFYTLNNAAIPKKYKEFFLNMNAKAIQEIENHMHVKYDLFGLNLKNILNNNLEFRNIIEHNIENDKANFSLKGIQNKISYLFDSVKNIKNRRGFIVTFSGVDGAGKSTIIESLKLQIARKYRKKVIVIRHRPSLLPIISSFKYGKKEAEKRTTHKLPRTGTNKNKLSSLLRFSYYYLDYVIGQFYIQAKYVLRGYVVLYDRYYFDFINDAKRSNIQLPAALPKFLYRFILKPKLNIFLHAKPEVILSRKQELNEIAIKTLTNKYIHLFNEFDSRFKDSNYRSIENIEQEKTVNKLLDELSDAA